MKLFTPHITQYQLTCNYGYIEPIMEILEIKIIGTAT